MKKTIVLFLISLFTLQSCNINTEIVYHKDAASSIITDIDTREFMAEMQAMTPDSLQQEKFKDMDRFPPTWTSKPGHRQNSEKNFYEIYQRR